MSRDLRAALLAGSIDRRGEASRCAALEAVNAATPVVSSFAVLALAIGPS